ncbi:MAG: polysaccharide biosynthesis/export family protein [Planctomycetes bacterium]|nr:polysaccharide biosynthesis/export family protein [Planctomycetota bacterium]
MPTEGRKVALPPYIIEPPDILLIESTQSLRDQAVRGQHLVRPDGTVGVGIYGSIRVGGLTLEQARLAIADLVAQRVKNFDARNLWVDVLAYNSKFYYVIADGGGYGAQVTRLPITGSETVLDAIAQVNGLPAVAAKGRIWLARRCLDGGPEILPVDWKGMVEGGAVATNYQIMPGDRIYVESDHWIRADSFLAKRLAPIERLFGVTLLGSTTVNSITHKGTVTVP